MNRFLNIAVSFAAIQLLSACSFVGADEQGQNDKLVASGVSGEVKKTQDQGGSDFQIAAQENLFAIENLKSASIVQVPVQDRRSCDESGPNAGKYLDIKFTSRIDNIDYALEVMLVAKGQINVGNYYTISNADYKEARYDMGVMKYDGTPVARLVAKNAGTSETLVETTPKGQVFVESYDRRTDRLTVRIDYKVGDHDYSTRYAAKIYDTELVHPGC